MKKLTGITMLIACAMLMLSSCTKEGPAGPAGKDGKDGVDASATCIQCHNDNTELVARVNQYQHSTHYNGGNYERNGTTCAACHTHEGFMEYLETGNRVTAAAPDNPSMIHCRSCHKIHTTYTAADYGLTLTSAVKLDINDVEVNIGSGNMCVACHQPRVPSPALVMGGGDLNITSYRWGYHHGPQAALLANTGGYEVAGSMSYTPAASGGHLTTVDNGCVDCHMATAFGAQAGGHTFMMSYISNGTNNIVACTPCHADATSFDYQGFQTEIEMYLDSLGNVLTDLGVRRPDGYITTGTRTELEAGAYLNFQFLSEDRSLGIHNPKYTKALLVNTLEALAKK